MTGEDGQQQQQQQQQQQPAVSVVIAVHDGASHVAGLRRMLDAQVLLDLEVVLVDDASVDSTPDVLRAWADESSDPAARPVKVLRLERQSGASAARRAGLHAARGRWVWFADADDRFDPDLLSNAYELAERHRAHIVCFRARAEHEDGRPHPVVLYGQPAPAEARVVEGRGSVDAVFSGAVMGYLWDKLFSREMLTRAFAQPIDLRTHEDLLLLLRTLALRPRMVLAPGSPYTYVVRQSSLSNVRRPSYPDLAECGQEADAVAQQQGPGPHYGTFAARYIGLAAIDDAVRKGRAGDVRAAAALCGPRLRAASVREVARDHGWRIAMRVAVAACAPTQYGLLTRAVRGASRIAKRVRP